MKLIDGYNDFYESRFAVMCEELEKGEHIQVYIDCIGHTRNNMTQEQYRTKLVEKYGERLEVTCHEGWCVYSYSYKLK